MTAGLLSTAHRLIFAAVLLPWALGTAASMVTGTALSMGPPIGSFGLTLGAYSFWLPDILSRLDTAPTLAETALVLGMTLALAALPLMIVAGLATRAASLGWLIFLAAMGVLAPADQRGRLFDLDAFSMTPDMTLLWAALVLPLILHGAGPISLDGLIGRLSGDHAPR